MSKLRPYLADIASAIREKKGSSEPINAKDFSNEIRSIQSGGGDVVEVEEKDVNFYDYDGTLLFSYSIEEAQALTELPTPKGHEGLVFDGWNWDYEDVIALDYPMDIGAVYVTDDGATRLYLKIENDKAKKVYLNLTATKAQGVLIDWGDGTQEVPTTSTINASHEYNNLGDFVISIKSLNGTYKLSGYILGTLNSPAFERVSALKKVEIGTNVTEIDSYCFQQCVNLKTIIISNSVTNCGGYSLFEGCSSLVYLVLPKSVKSLYYTPFLYCAALKGVSLSVEFNTMGLNTFGNTPRIRKMRIPPKVTALANYSFQNGYSLQEVSIPDSVTSLGAYTFQNCCSLVNVKIPDIVTTIESGTFHNNNSLALFAAPSKLTNIKASAINCKYCTLYDFSRCEGVPVLAATNSISSLNTAAKIIVPDALYDEWIAATNWSTYASYIVKASEYVEQ